MASPVRATSDFFVRYLLGSEENKPILVDFINSMLLDAGLTGIQDADPDYRPTNLSQYINTHGWPENLEG